MRNQHSTLDVRPWYPVELPVLYQSPEHDSVRGSGRTLAINSRDVRFASDRDLLVGLDIRLVISWPARLPDGAGLNLWVFGKIERTASREVNVAISRHMFRTRGGKTLATSDNLLRFPCHVQVDKRDRKLTAVVQGDPQVVAY